MMDGQPNYLSVNPDGTVAAQFTGGVDLVAGNVQSPVLGKAIRWHKDTVTGAVIADVFAYDSGDGLSELLRVEQNNPTNNANASAAIQLRAIAQRGGGANVRGAFLEINGDGEAGNVSAIKFLADNDNAYRHLWIGNPSLPNRGFSTFIYDGNQAATTARSIRDYGQYNMAPGTINVLPHAEATWRLNHGINFTDPAGYTLQVMGNLYDGNFANRCTWRWANVDPNNIDIVFYNTDPTNTSTPGFGCWIRFASS